MSTVALLDLFNASSTVAKRLSPGLSFPEHPLARRLPLLREQTSPKLWAS
jgi:hypothetical protein